MEIGNALDVAKADFRTKQQQETAAATMATPMDLEPGSKNVPTAMVPAMPTGLHRPPVKDAADPEKFHTKLQT